MCLEPVSSGAEMVVDGPGALPLLLCCRSLVPKAIYYSNKNAWSNLVHEIHLGIYGWIQFSAIPGMKPLSCPSQFILWQGAVKNNFQEKKLFHRGSTLGFVRLFAAAAATSIHFWRLEGHAGTLCISVWICNTWCNLMQEIQFLGGSNLTHAHSNAVICKCFKYGRRDLELCHTYIL